MSNTDRNLSSIVVEMVQTGLPAAFALRVLELSRESEGVEDLLHLWWEAPNVEERRELEADLQGMIEDRDPPTDSFPVNSAEDGDRLLRVRSEHKEYLRWLVEKHGGVSRVARLAEMPQPSLSRLLNSMSEPRLTTLSRLAKAMGLAPSELDPPTVSAFPTESVVGSATEGTSSRRAAARLQSCLQRFERKLVRPLGGMEAA